MRRSLREVQGKTVGEDKARSGQKQHKRTRICRKARKIRREENYAAHKDKRADVLPLSRPDAVQRCARRN